MFSNTAYEAMYQYIGLSLHSKFIEILTSESIFKAVILLIFGVLFFLTTVKFFSRYMPATIVQRRPVPLSSYVKLVFCLFLGLGLLRVGVNTGVKNFERKSWDENPHIQMKVPGVQKNYRVSFVFDLLMRTAEETGALASKVVDRLFESTHSQTKVPNFFFKSMMYAASSTIDDQRLKDQIDYFTIECFDRLIPLLPSSVLVPTGSGAQMISGIDSFIEFNGAVDSRLEKLKVPMPDGSVTDCKSLKTSLRANLSGYAASKSDGFEQTFEDLHKRPFLNKEVWKNMQTSSLLVNHFMEKREGRLGIQKGAETEGTVGAIYHTLNRVSSFGGIMGAVGLKELQGAALAAERAQQFSEDLARAPHVAGFTKMLLIAIFPALIFLVVAGHWKVLIMWFTAYISVVLWTPIWTLLYHIMTNISLSASAMESFGQLTTGVSLYGSKLIGSKIYYLYSVYSWLQVLIGPVFTVLVLYMFKPIFTDTQGESQPEFVGEASKQAGNVASVGTKVMGAI
jgi:hypothetical protein